MPGKQKIKINVYLQNKNNNINFIFSMPTDELGFSYHIITMDKNQKPTIKKLEHPADTLDFNTLTPVEYGSIKYDEFINLYAASKRAAERHSKNSEIKAAEIKRLNKKPTK